jgi:tRNA U55 pseudouridine synthase TruB
VVEVKEREVTISLLELSRAPGARDVAFRVGCSKGTYIRSLVNDLVRAAPRARRLARGALAPGPAEHAPRVQRKRSRPPPARVAARAGKGRECFC